MKEYFEKPDFVFMLLIALVIGFGIGFVIGFGIGFVVSTVWK